MFRLSDEKLDLQALKDAMRDPVNGACVTFEGLVRNHNHGREVLRLEYEAYSALAVKEGEKLVQEAMRIFPVTMVHCVHRVGMLEIGDVAVWIGATAAHRREAFEACSHVIEQIKLKVPIWKREYYPGGEATWVRCEEHHCGEEGLHDAARVGG